MTDTSQDFWSQVDGTGCSVDGGSNLACPFELDGRDGGDIGRLFRTGLGNVVDGVWGVVQQNAAVIIAVLTGFVIVGVIAIVVRKVTREDEADPTLYGVVDPSSDRRRRS